MTEQTYGPPLRLKAVDPETGKDLTEHAIVGVARLRDFESWVKAIAAQGDFILCQSTGLTDAAGKEVFAGDVLVDLDGKTREIIWDDCCFEMKGRYKLRFLQTTPSCFRVIGNQWMPTDTLKARAQEAAHG